MNLESLPPRIPTSKVCELAGYGPGTLRTRIKDGEMPHPVDRAKESLFLTSEILPRLGLGAEPKIENPFEKSLNELEKAKIRHFPKK